MKLLVLFVFAGCAVKCDEANNYYVIERPSQAPVRELKTFQVYWNVPTKQCRSKNIPFDSLQQRYGIVQNKDDSFQGEQVVILYDPGLFPAILKDDTSGKLKFRNGGVPQEGNLDEHLTAFRFTLDQSIPDPEFSGIGIIDFESWRPIFRQNFGELTPYKNVSLLNERRLHPWWTRGMIEAEAKYRFERAGREFMQATASLARLLRPRARWGYYGFPYCFNMASNNLVETCSDKVRKENDQISWLWSESTSLYPSVYSSKSLSSSQLASLIRGRVAESARVSRGLPILPYFWFKYRDAGFMSEVDLKTALKTMYKSNASGFIIWGSSNDVNTVAKCEKLKNYLENVLGPTVALYTKQTLKIDDLYTKEPNSNNDTNQVNVTTESSLDLLTSETKDDLNVDEDNTKDTKNSESNENYGEDIPKKLSDALATSDSNVDVGDKPKEQNNSILIDILLSIIENVQKSENKDEMAKEMIKINKDRKKGTPIHDTFTKVSTENYFDLSTRNPFLKKKKKGEIFSSLFTTDVTTELNNITTTNDVTSVADSTSTPINVMTTNSEYSYVSTTDIWEDNNTFYNEDTFLDQEFTYNTPELTSETYEEGTYNTEYRNEHTTTRAVKYTTEITTEANEIDLDFKESLGTTTENVFNTTDGTTEINTDTNNESLSVASENNQVVISVV